MNLQILLLTLCTAWCHDVRVDSDGIEDLNEGMSFFQGVHPSSYIVRLSLPIKGDSANNYSGSNYFTNGSVSMTFTWVSASTGLFQSPQRVLALHSKLIDIEEKSVRLWEIQHLTGLSKHIPVEHLATYNDQEMITVRLNTHDHLKTGVVYRLEIGEFHSRVEDDGSKNAIFLTSPGLATQFQLNDARRAFPCVDSPNKKAVFKFFIRHPNDYIALFNTELDIGTSNPGSVDGWTTTTFLPTPVMSTYILAFALIPKVFVEKASFNTEASDGTRISIFYNPDHQTNTKQPSTLLKYATGAYENLRLIFSPRLPINKIDVCLVKGLSILGMENWGVVNLREEYVKKENEIEQFGLIAHELVHQWVGNLATTADWRHLCVQEGLTEHYARRVLSNFYGGNQSWQYQRYMFIRYLSAILNETNNVHLKPIRQDFQDFDQAVAYCFGRVPFVWTMIEHFVGRKEFDILINRFLTDFSYKNFILDDLLSYFNQSEKAASVLQYYVDHGGYPSLFVRRVNSSAFLLRQRQIVPLSSAVSGPEAIFEVPSTKDIWPIPLSTNSGPILMITNEYDLSIDSMPFDHRGVPLLNPDFVYFYRINYEGDTWLSIANALLSSPHAYGDITKAQFLNDFCFFRSLNLIHMPFEDKKGMLNWLTDQFQAIQSQLELNTNVFVRYFITGCS